MPNRPIVDRDYNLPILHGSMGKP